MVYANGVSIRLISDLKIIFYRFNYLIYNPKTGFFIP